MRKNCRFAVVIFICFFAFTSCRGLLPTSKTLVKSRWQDFGSIQADYEKIIPGKTTMEELNQMGFAPNQEPNIRILNATDIVNMFLPNSSIRLEDLHPGLQKCIESREQCIAYRIEPNVLDTKRIGSFWLDLLSFKRDTVATGWEFRGLITIVDGVVTYRDPVGGRPTISTEDIQKKPLGPLQDIGGAIQGTVPSLLR